MTMIHNKIFYVYIVDTSIDIFKNKKKEAKIQEKKMNGITNVNIDVSN